MPNFCKCILILCFAGYVLRPGITAAQNVLGYTDVRGRYFVFKNGYPEQTENLPILSYQNSNAGIAYVDNSGLLNFVNADGKVNLDILAKSFYKNTDNYLYYGVGDLIGMYDGRQKWTLGDISKYPYSISDSIAAYHDFNGFFSVFWEGQETVLSRLPITYMATGKNILAFVDNSNLIQLFYRNTITQIDINIPASLVLGANIAAWVDSYREFKIFYGGHIYDMYNIAELFCRQGETIADITYNFDAELFCAGTIVHPRFNNLPLFMAGDDMIMFIDDLNYLQVFYKGAVYEASNTVPLQYDVVDNIAWFIDLNGFLNVFYQGEFFVVESYTPGNLTADRDIVCYTDLDNRLIAFYKGKRYEVSKDIIRSYFLNNHSIIYSIKENEYKYFSFD